MVGAKKGRGRDITRKGLNSRIPDLEKLGLNSNEIKTFALRVKPQLLKDVNEFRSIRFRSAYQWIYRLLYNGYGSYIMDI